MRYQLAQALGKTVGELDSMGAKEYNEWIVYLSADNDRDDWIRDPVAMQAVLKTMATNITSGSN